MKNILVDLDKTRDGSTPPPRRSLVPGTAARVADPERTEWLLDFPWAQNPVPMNGSRGGHYTHAKKVKLARTIAYRSATFAGIPPLKHCRVQLTWYVTTAGRRDPNNLATLLKALQDGIVDAGVVPDDTPDLMDTVMSRIVKVDPKRHRQAWMELTVTRWGGPESEDN